MVLRLKALFGVWAEGIEEKGALGI